MAISSRTTSGPMFSRIATYSISGVISPRRAYASWVTGWPSRLRRGCRGRPGKTASRLRSPPRGEVCLSPSSSGRTGRPAYSSVSPRATIQFSRSGARPRRTSVSVAGSVYGPDVSYSVTASPLVRCTCRTGTRRSGREPWTYPLCQPMDFPASSLWFEAGVRASDVVMRPTPYAGITR